MTTPSSQTRSPEDDRPDDRLGRAITSRRAWLGMKRKDLAAAAGLSYPYVAEIENGTKVPSSRALKAIATALGVTSSELMASAEEAPPADSDETWDSDLAPSSGSDWTLALQTSAPVKTMSSAGSAGPWSIDRRRTEKESYDEFASELLDELRTLRRRVERMDEEIHSLRELLRRNGIL